MIERMQGLGGFLLIAGTVLILDQATKLMAIAWLADDRDVVLIPRVLQLIHRTNTGAAWSMFQDSPKILTIFATVVAGGLAVWSVLLRPEERILRLPLAMILGGAVGNLADRYRLGHVVDFIDAHWDDVYHFPTFNVADSAICIGMALLIWMNLRVSSEAADASTKNGPA
jgi:signal peptidase II